MSPRFFYSIWETLNYGSDYLGLLGGVRGAPMVGNLIDSTLLYVL